MASLFSTEGAATYLGIPYATFYNWVKEGKGPEFTLIGKTRVFMVEDLDEWAEAHKKTVTVYEP